MKNELENYQAMDLLGLSVPDLIVKIYDGAITNLNQAKTCYSKENLQGGYEAMEKARKFVVHLYTTLDKEKGGDIAENLGKLYVFIVEQINLVQATKNIKAIDDSINILNNVKEGWMQLSENLKRSAPMDSVSQPGGATKSLSLSI